MSEIIGIEIERDEDEAITDLRILFADGSTASVSADADGYELMGELLEELRDFYDSLEEPGEEE